MNGVPEKGRDTTGRGRAHDPARREPPWPAGSVHGPSPGGAKCVSLTAPRAVYAGEQPDFRGLAPRLASLRIGFATLIPDSGMPQWYSGVLQSPSVGRGHSRREGGSAERQLTRGARSSAVGPARDPTDRPEGRPTGRTDLPGGRAPTGEPGRSWPGRPWFSGTCLLRHIPGSARRMPAGRSSEAAKSGWFA
jgi:hypothetical protein